MPKFLNSTVSEIFLLEPLPEMENHDRIGVEVEAEGDMLPLIKRKGWRNENDNSLRGGIEYVSPIMTIDEWPDAANHIKTLFLNRFVLSDRAGIHIHFNMRDLTMLELARFLTYWYMIEELVVSTCGENRQGNHFCFRMIDAPAVIESLYNVYQERSKRALRTDALRYSALNLQSLFKFGTVEYRAMQTTQDLFPSHQIIKILERLKKKAKETVTTPDEILLEFSAGEGGAEAFVSSLIGEDMLKFIKKNTIINRSFEESIDDSIRLMQDFVFLNNWKG